MHSLRTTAALVLLSSSLVAGCATISFEEHMPSLGPLATSGKPRIKIDETASLIAVAPPRTNGFLFGKLEEASFQRTDVVKGIEAAWNQNTTSGGSRPARVIASGVIEPSGGWTVGAIDGGIFTGGLWELLGLPTAGASATADIVLEVDHATFTGTGHGKCLAGLYYPGDPDQCAFSKAVMEALRNAIK